MNHRHLRIAFSVVCGVLGLLLIALWVRSYWRVDAAYRVGVDTPFRSFTSIRGFIFFSTMDETRPGKGKWNYQGYALSDDTSLTPKPKRSLFLKYEFQHKPRYLAIWVPYWMPVGFSAFIAAIPWLPWRFSLRSLLVATTLVAVVLGLILYAAK